MRGEKKPDSESEQPCALKKPGKIKIEVYGEEMVDKLVGSSADSGRVYLPPAWAGSRVKIIRLD